MKVSSSKAGPRICRQDSQVSCNCFMTAKHTIGVLGGFSRCSPAVRATHVERWPPHERQNGVSSLRLMLQKSNPPVCQWSGSLQSPGWQSGRWRWFPRWQAGAGALPAALAPLA